MTNRIKRECYAIFCGAVLLLTLSYVESFVVCLVLIVIIGEGRGGKIILKKGIIFLQN